MVSKCTVYVDESGDLGWSFGAPYQSRGSSRYLTIGAVLTPETRAHLPARVVRDLDMEHKWSTEKEKKWAKMSKVARLDFAEKAAKLLTAYADIKCFAITVKKENVQQHLRADSNLLYNYMLKLLIIDELAACSEVTLIPDPRTIKVASGNSQHEYLQTTLWYDKNVKTKLHTKPIDSKKDLGIQFVDMLCGVVQTHQERGASNPWKKLSHKIQWQSLFY
jgi:Protein of unknown function (DUF3800)